MPKHTVEQSASTPSKFWFMAFLVICAGLALIALERQIGIVNNSIELDIDFALLTLIAQAFFLIYATLLWRDILTETTTLKITLSDSFSHITTVTLGKYLPGKIWGLVARGSHLKSYGLNLENYIKISFLEQYLLLLASAIVALLSTPLFVNVPVASFTPLLTVPTIILAYYLQAPIYSIYSQRLHKASNPITHEFTPLRLMQFARYLIRYLVLWTLNGGVFALFFHAISSSTPEVVILLKIIACNAISVTVGFLAIFAPGGIGVREASITAIMTPAIGSTSAVFLAIGYRAFTIFSELACGLISFVISWKKSSD